MIRRQLQAILYPLTTLSLRSSVLDISEWQKFCQFFPFPTVLDFETSKKKKFREGFYSESKLLLQYSASDKATQSTIWGEKLQESGVEIAPYKLRLMNSTATTICARAVRRWSVWNLGLSKNATLTDNYSFRTLWNGCSWTNFSQSL